MDIVPGEACDKVVVVIDMSMTAIRFFSPAGDAAEALTARRQRATPRLMMQVAVGSIGLEAFLVKCGAFLIMSADKVPTGDLLLQVGPGTEVPEYWPVPEPVHTIDAIAAELHDRYRKRLILFASRRLPDPSVAEDVAQETLRRVLEALRAQRVENLAALPGFVFQTARNICMQRGRSVRRERGALLRFSSGATGVANEEPSAELITRERLEGVRRAIQGLDAAEQELLRWLYVDALETAEIADRLGIDPGALRVRKHRLLRRLAQIVGNDQEGAGT